MARVIAAQVRWPAVDGEPADDCTNTFHFQHIPTADWSAPGVIDNLVDLLTDFYMEVPATGTKPLSGYISTLVAQTAEVKFYALDDAKPRTPGFVTTITNTATRSSDKLPPEVAAVMSWQAEAQSGVRQSSRRNRIYLGPLGAPALDLGSGKLSNTFTANAAKSMKQMWMAANASITWQWVVYSPTRQESYAIDNGWVDNDPDIQRRRGRKATARVTFGP